MPRGQHGSNKTVAVSHLAAPLGLPSASVKAQDETLSSQTLSADPERRNKGSMVKNIHSSVYPFPKAGGKARLEGESDREEPAPSDEGMINH